MVSAHPLVRATVYGDLVPGLRRRLHLAAAGVLAPSASFAHRVAAAAGVSDDRLAEELREAAADAEAEGAPRRSARYLVWAWRVDGDRGAARRACSTPSGRR